MNPDSQHPSAGERLLRRLSASTGEGAFSPPPGVPESVLWAHAFGHLDPTEEPAVLEALARSPESRARLEELRQNIAIAAVRSGAPSMPPDAIPVRLLAVLRAQGQALVAAFLRTGSTLEAFVREPAWVLENPAGAVLGERGVLTAPSEGAPAEWVPGQTPLPSSPVQKVTGPQGITVQVTREYGTGATVIVCFPLPWPTTAVEVHYLELHGEALTVTGQSSAQPDAAGHCRFEDCPDGVIEVRAPGRPPILLYLGETTGPAAD